MAHAATGPRRTCCGRCCCSRSASCSPRSSWSATSLHCADPVAAARRGVRARCHRVADRCGGHRGDDRAPAAAVAGHADPQRREPHQRRVRVSSRSSSRWRRWPPACSRWGRRAASSCCVAAGGAAIGVVIAFLVSRLRVRVAPRRRRRCRRCRRCCRCSRPSPPTSPPSASTPRASSRSSAPACYAGWHDARQMSVADAAARVAGVDDGAVRLQRAGVPAARASSLPPGDPRPRGHAVLERARRFTRACSGSSSTVDPAPVGLSRAPTCRRCSSARSARASRCAIRAPCSSSAGRGLRGSVTMAAALSLPVVDRARTRRFPVATRSSSSPPPRSCSRSLINGLSLPPIIRALGLRGDGAAERELRAAEIALAQAATARLSARCRACPTAEERQFAQRLLTDYEHRIALHTANADAGAALWKARRTGIGGSCCSRCAGRARRARIAARPGRHQRRDGARHRAAHRPRRARTPGCHRCGARALKPPVALLGGTFDPVHYGHLRFADAIRRALGLDDVRLVPASDPPHRAGPQASAADRVAMLELAVAEFPGLVVDEREIARAGKSYTVLTLEELRREDPQRPVLLLLGADAFLGLPTWHRWREIFGLAHLVVVAAPRRGAGGRPAARARARVERPGDAGPRRLVFDAGRRHLRGVRPAAADRGHRDTRATRARARRAATRLRNCSRRAVLAYIDQHGLYSTLPDAT